MSSRKLSQEWPENGNFRHCVKEFEEVQSLPVPLTSRMKIVLKHSWIIKPSCINHVI